MWRLKQIKESTQSVIWFLPTIWKDRDYEGDFIYDLLARKLEKIEMYKKKYELNLPKDKETKNIKTAKNLCHRLSKDDYLGNATFWYDKVYYEENLNRLYSILHYEDATRNPKEEKSFDHCCKHSEYMKNQDRKLLFKILEKNIDKWWY